MRWRPSLAPSSDEAPTPAPRGCSGRLPLAREVGLQLGALAFEGLLGLFDHLELLSVLLEPVVGVGKHRVLTLQHSDLLARLVSLLLRDLTGRLFAIDVERLVGCRTFDEQ